MTAFYSVSGKSFLGAPSSSISTQRLTTPEDFAELFFTEIPIGWQRLDFSFDMSIPNVAHLDPQRGGCCTIMPYFIGNFSNCQ